MIASCIKTRGGWIFDNKVLKGTGVAVGTFISLLSNPVEANIGTAGLRTVNSQHFYGSLNPVLKVYLQESNDIVATTADNLAKIRDVFKPAISDLANIFGVSRQAIYNWISGEEPIDVHARKIKDFADAADLVNESGLLISGHVLKRKIVDGKSLFELVESGASAKESMLNLLKILKRETEQRKQVEQRLAKRPKPQINSMDIGSLVINEIG